jgi:hypothetical protein
LIFWTNYHFLSEKKRFLQKKKKRHTSVTHWCPGIIFSSFNLETAFFQVINILVLHGAYCFFSYFDELLCSEAKVWLFQNS